MLFDYISLAGGLVVLIIAGDVLVRGSVGIAQRLGIPNLVIGLTIVAFGTSAPELVISLKAALEGAGGIAIGNVVGSNIANVLLVLGMPALIAATPCGETGATRNALFMVAVTIVFMALCFFTPIGLTAGLILLALLGVFLAASTMMAQKHRKEQKAIAAASAGAAAADIPMEDDDGLDEVEDVPDSVWIALAYILLGLVGLPLGAHFTISGATSIATSWGVSEAVIGLTVIALGTSLPELATTVMAAIRQHGAVAIGNVIGSNVFNLLAIIGITAVIVPIDVPQEVLKLDIWVMLACAILLTILAGMRICLGRISGAVMTAAYCAYIATVYVLGHTS
ncbi:MULTISPECIES: calcium/sodium antiporter [Stappiaceae]|jgi:cation:H+ antiporter|uniref:Inner membrane protein YrbG n=2 Tax=Roseibium TaxID=150830 RepID=A0A0M6Y2R3_9HYPH|nr:MULTISPECIES: calcium/sodium antiporter [Stappiaceae]MCR9280980.1 calcium/sodium antiporter [Paracoccaceae bacterium]MEC9418115.1 calcium/sodium antiporter [Pseudomonadota bacterium]AQQ05512.1 sodium:proton exchanger [Roseibium aggregatum]ERP98547.1 K+-dependent Na+/Ca+ exchanger [Labrenzia sp. C1B10]ERR00053.1 K+-dependent Na+/Ca+ exchanger [Labrenzia sp. C1B70]